MHGGSQRVSSGKIRKFFGKALSHYQSWWDLKNWLF